MTNGDFDISANTRERGVRAFRVPFAGRISGEYKSKTRVKSSGYAIGEELIGFHINPELLKRTFWIYGEQSSATGRIITDIEFLYQGSITYSQRWNESNAVPTENLITERPATGFFSVDSGPSTEALLVWSLQMGTPAIVLPQYINVSADYVRWKTRQITPDGNLFRMFLAVRSQTLFI